MRSTSVVRLILSATAIAACVPRAPGVSATGPQAVAVARAPSSALSDGEIRAAVVRELSRDPAVASARIQVQSTDGIVEITGATDNLLTKERATRHAEVVKGVRAVINRIVIDPPKVADAALAIDVRNALAADAATDAYELEVGARDGIVTISGKVESIQEKRFAGLVAKGVRGVAGLKNAIEVTHTSARTDREIARDVEARLRWDVLVDDGLIAVDANDGTVHLSGTVRSAAEKSRATWDAWVTGVRDVDASRLEVKWSARSDDLRKNKYTIKEPAEIERAVLGALTQDPRVDARRVSVTASGGVATLKGKVATAAAKSAAVQIASHTVGVLTVNDHLEVEPSAPVSDAELAKRVRSALLRNPFTDRLEIATSASNGRVVLRGSVDSSLERAEAESVAARISGARVIDNRLDVEKPAAGDVFDPYISLFDPYVTSIFIVAPEPLRPDVVIAREIARELFWSPFVDGEDVTVTVERGRATLSGIVDTWRERSAAAESAIEGGAIAVENKLAVR